MPPGKCVCRNLDFDRVFGTFLVKLKKSNQVLNVDNIEYWSFFPAALKTNDEINLYDVSVRWMLATGSSILFLSVRIARVAVVQIARGSSNHW